MIDHNVLLTLGGRVNTTSERIHHAIRWALEPFKPRSVVLETTNTIPNLEMHLLIAVRFRGWELEELFSIPANMRHEEWYEPLVEQVYERFYIRMHTPESNIVLGEN